MNRTIVYLLPLLFGLCSCTDENQISTPFSDEHAIELLAFGFADNPTEENKGFGVANYFYLDLTTDSVFIQSKVDTGGTYVTIARAGTIAGLAKEPVVSAFIKATAEYESGKTISAPIEEGVLYCGSTYYSNYKNRSGERFHYYTTHGLDSRIKDATRYFLSLRSDSRLTESNQLLHEDDLVVPIINHASFKFGPPPPFDLPPPPPPPVRSEINFAPPLEKR